MNRRTFLGASGVSCALLAGCTDLPNTGPSGADNRPEGFPERAEPPVEFTPPDAELKYEHDRDTGTLTITHDGGETLTPENTGWVAIFTLLDVRIVEQETVDKQLRAAWHIADGDRGFPMEPGESVSIEDVDVDHTVAIAWSKPNRKMRKWSRKILWRDYHPKGYFNMEYEEESSELRVRYSENNDDPIPGTGGVSLSVVKNREYDSEIALAGEDANIFTFPVEPGDSARVPVDGAEKDIFELYWRGPNKSRFKIGSASV